MPIDNLTFSEYQALPGLNWSSLKHYGRSPAHYREAIDNPPPSTPAMVFGQLVHAMILEQSLADYAILPEGIDRRTKAGKEAWAAFQEEADGKTIVTAEQLGLADSMSRMVTGHPLANRLLSAPDMQREVSFTWQDLETRQDCKCRVDAWSSSDRLVIDLKTTDDATLEGFSRAAYRYGYHGQSAFYLDALEMQGYEPSGFVFVAVEKAPPCNVAVFLADEEFLEAGRRLYRHALERHRECTEKNSWPGYPVQTQTLTLPRWAKELA